MKLRKLLNYAEPLGHFMAFVPGQRRQQVWPLDGGLHRAPADPPLMLGIPDEEGFRCARWASSNADGEGGGQSRDAGSRCPECGNATLIHRDGCDFCTVCGYVGQCGWIYTIR